MPDGSTPATPATLTPILASLEERLNRGEIGNALEQLQAAKALAAMGERPVREHCDQKGHTVARETICCPTMESQADDERDDDAPSVDDVLVADVSFHRATCMQHALTEWQSAHVDENSGPHDDDLHYGRWLIGTAVTQLLRVASQQHRQEYRNKWRHDHEPRQQRD